MSCVRYFNSTPHIVRFGMQDEKSHNGWVSFWRAGVKFEVSISGADISGTRFEKQWTELNRESNSMGVNDDWRKRWRMLCDCIISQCLDVLEELAPVREHWKTLRDYVHTPGYELKIVNDEQLGDAKAICVGGPKASGAYEMEPMPLEEVAIDVSGIPRHESQDLMVVDKDKDWRQGPCRVRAPNEDVFAIEYVQGYALSTNTDKWMNWSLDVIRAHIKVHEHCATHHIAVPTRIPHVLGYVTDDTVPSENREWRRSDGQAILIDPDSQPQSFIAGILLTNFSGDTITLAKSVSAAKTDPALLVCIKENQKKWRSQALDIVNDLHTKGMACGYFAQAKRSYIDERSINVDDEQVVWIDPRTVMHFVAPEEVGPLSVAPTSEFDKARKEDLDGVQTAFDQWLPAELGKIEASTIET